jgi:hypothetical protein
VGAEFRWSDLVERWSPEEKFRGDESVKDAGLGVGDGG